MPTFACDVSYYQRVVNDSYPHRWFIFRSNDGTFRDPHFAANLRWAKRAFARGRLDGYTLYCVPRPGVDAVGVQMAMVGGKPAAGMTSMLDVESWAGKIRGNHSTYFTGQANKLAHWYGDHDRVIAYGNQYDLRSLYPKRPSWLRLIVAGYSSQLTYTDVDHAIGQQYSDGSPRWSVPHGYPRSSKPFGRCDHNVFPGRTSKQLAQLLGVSRESAHTATPPAVRPSPVPKTPVTPAAPPKEIDMPMLVSVKNPVGGKVGIHLLDGGRLFRVTTPDDWRGFVKRLGPATPISESQFLALGGKR